jgi:hypothetical protein
MAVTNTNSYGSLSKYLPSKVISGQSTSIKPLESWLYDDGTSDPWWQGAGGLPCKWILTATVNQVTHSSHLTQQPYLYNGLDVTPGMWICSSSDSTSVRIDSIISQTTGSIQCVVEDVNRYNTFRDPTSGGNGIFGYPSSIIFYTLGDDGLPKLDPLPIAVDPSLVVQIESRFKVFNPNNEYRFYQVNHGFVEGSVLKLNPATKMFENSTSTDIFRVGTVVSVGPGPNYFYMAPTTKFITDLEPGLPGTVGSVIWLDSTTGEMTTTPNNSKVPVYIQMTDPIASFTIGTVDNPVAYDGFGFTINKVAVNIHGGADAIPTSDVITAINNLTVDHGVTASMGSPVNKVVGTVSFPSTNVSPNMVFTLNNVTIAVAPPSITFGNSGTVGWWDFVRSINEHTAEHGVFATVDPNTGFMSFEHAAGEAIVFANVTPTTSAGGISTFTDTVGVALNNQPATASKLKLTRSDGGQIIISDTVGSFFANAGITSSANGTLPLALVVDQAMYANASYMVNTIADRDVLANLRSGDQVYVQSDLDGEWALYVKVPTGWTKIANADSASTDAKTLEVQISNTATGPILLGNISSGTRIVDIAIRVDTVFDGTPTITVGTSGSPNAIFDSQNADLTVLGTYETSSSFVASTTDGTDVDIYVYLSGAATTGSATVIVSYL